LKILFNPWVLIALAANVVLYLAYSGSQLDTPLPAFLSAFRGLASAVLGAIIAKRWLDVTEGRVVVTRGKSAVPSLQLLFRNIGAFQERITAFLDQQEKGKDSPEITKRNYEEISKNCNRLQEEALLSIQDWTDIVPEADIKTYFEELGKLRKSAEEKTTELTALRSELEAAKGDSEREREQARRLRKEIAEKKRQISDLRWDMTQRGIFAGTSSPVTGTSTITGFGTISTAAAPMPGNLEDTFPLLRSRSKVRPAFHFPAPEPDSDDDKDKGK
jgi:hypothetical protein